jgi:hypothetical protein
MHIKRRSFGKIQTESFLIGILHLIGLLSLYRDDDKKRGRPYLYPTIVIHRYFSIDDTYHRKVSRACGLDTLPDRRTFDRRFKILPIQNIIGTIGLRFLREQGDGSIVSVDSSIIRAKNGHSWHRKQMIQGTIPRSGIDIDARWGFPSTKGWLYGYKLHICCTTGSIVVPLAAAVTSANVYDNQLYCTITERLPGEIRYVVADAGYDDWKLYDYTRQRGARLVCPIRRYRHTKGSRLGLVRFYKSRKGQKVYGTRSVSIEPLFQCIKETFGISSVPVIGFGNVSSYLLMCVFVYQIAVYYNTIVGNEKPRCIKYMIGN